MPCSGLTELPPTTSLFATNWDLAAARSLAIVRYLGGIGRVTPARLSAASYGEFQPIAPNDDFANRVKNRRADIVILYTPGRSAEERRP